jgi:tRNA(Ile)-lysidine synthase TilS/MesJ
MESRRLEKRLKERFVKAMATYHLIEDDDKILVGLSGGKDSLLLTELLAKRSKIQHPRFSVEAIHVRMANIHYETDTAYLEQFCKALGVKLHIVTTHFEVNEASQENLRSSFARLLPEGRKKPQTQTKAALFPLFVESTKTTLQPGTGTGMQQDRLRAPSG